MTEDQVQALAGLLGLTPGSRLDPAVALVALIAEAQNRGMTWAQIAPALHAPDGRQAKAAAKRLARDAQRKLLTTATATENR